MWQLLILPTEAFVFVQNGLILTFCFSETFQLKDKEKNNTSGAFSSNILIIFFNYHTSSTFSWYKAELIKNPWYFPLGREHSYLRRYSSCAANVQCGEGIYFQKQIKIIWANSILKIHCCTSQEGSDAAQPRTRSWGGGSPSCQDFQTAQEQISGCFWDKAAHPQALATAALTSSFLSSDSSAFRSSSFRMMPLSSAIFSWKRRASFSSNCCS